jgi:hypothetical protein
MINTIGHGSTPTDKVKSIFAEQGQVCRRQSNGFLQRKKFYPNYFGYQGIGNKKTAQYQEKTGCFIFNYVVNHWVSKIICGIRKNKLAIINQRGKAVIWLLPRSNTISSAMFTKKLNTIESPNPSINTVEETMPAGKNDIN